MQAYYLDVPDVLLRLHRHVGSDDEHAQPVHDFACKDGTQNTSITCKNTTSFKVYNTMA